MKKQNSKQNFDFDLEIYVYDYAQFCQEDRNRTKFQLNSAEKTKF